MHQPGVNIHLNHQHLSREAGSFLGQHRTLRWRTPPLLIAAAEPGIRRLGGRVGCAAGRDKPLAALLRRLAGVDFATIDSA